MTRGITQVLAVLAGIGGAAMMAIPANAGTLEWSGRVDDTATIYLKGRDVRVDSNMHGVKDTNQRVRGVLPPDRVRVSLDGARGRGRIRVIQQPNARNNYTAAVQIVDPQAGQDNYRFTLRWDGGDDRRPGRDRDRNDGHWH